MKNIKFTKIDITGKKNTQVSIESPYENLDFNDSLISQIVNAYLANLRSSNSHTKTRAIVAGTGKKPYKQKGTGYARFGSLRTPIHRGGGVAFGPKNEKNYKQKITKNAKRKSLAIMLNKKNEDKEVFVISEITLNSVKTKDLSAIIAKYPFKTGSILLLTEKNDKNLYLASRNIPYLNVKTVNDLNTLDLAIFDSIVFTGNSYKNVFSPTKNINKTIKK